MAGEWELEDVDAEIGIMEFAAWGPKSYSIRLRNGEEKVKSKGLSLNYATETLLNHKVMVDGVKEYLNNGSMTPIMVPQCIFEWSSLKTMTTRKMRKRACIETSELKGTLVMATLYPFGWGT